MQSGSNISVPEKDPPAADGKVQLLKLPSQLVTYINPLSLTGISVFKVQVEKMFTTVTYGLELPHSKLRGVRGLCVGTHINLCADTRSKWIMV